MWIKTLKNGAFYGIIGPFICGVFISIVMVLVVGISSPVNELAVIVLNILGWSFTVGFLPAFITGALIARAKLNVEALNKKQLFTYGFIGTLIVLILLNINLYIAMPKLLIGVAPLGFLEALPLFSLKRLFVNSHNKCIK
jgi:hypothetical protein